MQTYNRCKILNLQRNCSKMLTDGKIMFASLKKQFGSLHSFAKIILIDADKIGGS